jgi:hypothetical protein
MKVADLARARRDSVVTLPSALTGQYIEAGVRLISRILVTEPTLPHSLRLSSLSSSSLAAFSFRISERAKVLAHITSAVFSVVFVWVTVLLVISQQIC